MEKQVDELLKRLNNIADKLEPLIPNPSKTDWTTCIAGVWTKDRHVGYVLPIENFHRIQLADLLEIDRQKDALIKNTAQFCRKLPANNALLWGARGTGKSSLIHALLNEFRDEGLRLIELQKSDFADFPEIVRTVKDEPYRFLIVCDDLSFDQSDSSFKELKSILEGSIAATTENVLIYATSNRRHLIAEYMEENLSATYHKSELHESEAVEEKISLSDRFGLWLSFHSFNQDQYLSVVAHWLQKLSNESHVELFDIKSVKGDALKWALNRGVRNGRTAYHFARQCIGQHLLKSTKD